MRTIPLPDDFDEADYPDVRTCDWREQPHAVLDAVDILLKEHGLEVVLLETRSDYYAFKIEPRKAVE